jgi:hypothetical protein
MEFGTIVGACSLLILMVVLVYLPCPMRPYRWLFYIASPVLHSVVKENAYKTSVRPTLEYASTVWDPYHQKNIQQLEMVQRRWARYVSNRFGNRSSVDNMIATLEWKEERCKTGELPMFRLRRRNPNVLFAFPQMLLMWSLQRRSDVIWQPRYLALLTDSSMCPWRLYWYFTGFAFLLIVNMLHFPGWNSIFHFCSHMPSLSRANRTLGFLRRNLNIGSTSVKENAYKTSVRPTLEYASTVWDPYHQKDIQQLEMVQRRGARYVSNRFGKTAKIFSDIDWFQYVSMEIILVFHRICFLADC